MKNLFKRCSSLKLYHEFLRVGVMEYFMPFFNLKDLSLIYFMSPILVLVTFL